MNSLRRFAFLALAVVLAAAPAAHAQYAPSTPALFRATSTNTFALPIRI